MPTEKRLQKIIKAVDNRQSGLVVVFEDIHDPHNAEAILRTCDAFGVQEIYFIFEKEKYFNPGKVGKASSSTANKWLTYHIYKSAKECFSVLKKKGYQIAGTVLDESSEELYECDLTQKKLALMLGNEHSGLSLDAIKSVDRKLYIPMKGMVQSLNVSVTAAICLFEITRQRTMSGKNFQYPKKEKIHLIEDFVKR